jgi:hypothetical protein
MKLYVFWLIAIVGLLFVACDKEPNHHTIIEGRVLERYAKVPTPIPNAQVQLLSGSSVFLSNALPNTSDQVLADAQGNYRMEYDATNSWYEVVAYPVKDPKRQYYEGISVAVPNYGLNKIDCFLSPYAYLRVHIKNMSPKNTSDYFNLGGTTGSAGPFYGSPIDTTFVAKISGNERFVLTWFMTKNNIQTVKFDSIYCPAHDTIPYEIVY